MTAAELRALCVARVEARKIVGYGDAPERATGDALSRALGIRDYVCAPERTARAILAALDDAERVATERVLGDMSEYLAGRRVRRMEQIEDLEELADRQFARACVLEIGVALHWVRAREKALRESAKGGE